MTKIFVTKVPKDHPPLDPDNPLPWEYTEDAFLDWVWEVFQEGYKRVIPLLSLEKSISLVEGFGYEVKIEEDA